MGDFIDGVVCLRQRRFDVEDALCPDFFAEASILEQKFDVIRFRPVILIVKESKTHSFTILNRRHLCIECSDYSRWSSQ